jgi:hypothetical protein
MSVEGHDESKRGFENEQLSNLRGNESLQNPDGCIPAIKAGY